MVLTVLLAMRAHVLSHNCAVLVNRVGEEYFYTCTSMETRDLFKLTEYSDKIIMILDGGLSFYFVNTITVERQWQAFTESSLNWCLGYS